jgi:hypothetical protein
MQIFGRQVDGADLVLALVGVLLVLGGLAAFAGFFVLKGMGGRLAFLGASLALLVMGISLINTHVRKPKRGKPAIDG